MCLPVTGVRLPLLEAFALRAAGNAAAGAPRQ